MSGPELKNCPFCGDAMEPYGEHAQHPGDDCVLSQMIIFDDAYGEWNRRTPDPAQIRADALREAIWAAFIAGVGQGSDEATAYEWGTAPQQSRQQAFDDFMADWNEDIAYLRALLDTPLSPTAVDNSPAPDAGGKEDV